jgi:hypothetical protein
MVNDLQELIRFFSECYDALVGDDAEFIEHLYSEWEQRKRWGRIARQAAVDVALPHRDTGVPNVCAGFRDTSG